MLIFSVEVQEFIAYVIPVSKSLPPCMRPTFLNSGSQLHPLLYYLGLIALYVADNAEGISSVRRCVQKVKSAGEGW